MSHLLFNLYIEATLNVGELVFLLRKYVVFTRLHRGPDYFDILHPEYGTELVKNRPYNKLQPLDVFF